MKILLINQFFWPDAAATSQLLTDLARHLAAEGHEVHAIAANGGYTDGGTEQAPAVHIHRPPAIRFGRSTFGRLASYATFLLTASVKGLFIGRPDIVITLTTPPLLSLLGNMVKAVHGSAHYIWEMDVYPDIAVELGVFRADSLLTRVVGAVADFSRRRSDGIIALGECMRERLESHRIPAEKIFVADNWADGTAIHPGEQPAGTRQGSPLVVLYSGNLGLAHDTSTILETMASLKHRSDIDFVFAGGGPRRKAMEQECSERGLTNAHFRPYSSCENLGQSLSEGDFGLVTQLPASLGAVVPSKVYGLMAVACPILFIGPKQSTPARIIERFHCGWQVDCGDAESLVALLSRLGESRDEIRQAGLRARQAFEQHFDLPHGVHRISTIIGASEGVPVRSASSPDPRAVPMRAQLLK